MKISIVGSRGIPALYGGYETFCQQIYPELESLYFEVLIIGEKSNDINTNIKLPVKYLDFDKSDNPIRYYHESIKESIDWGAEKIILCGVGGILSTIYFRNKADFYINPDGIEFKRSKWEIHKRLFIYLQYVLCAIFAEHIICDSPGIKQYFKKYLFRYRNLHIAEYGTELNKIKTNKLESLSIEIDQDYYLIVSRLEPENNVKIMIEGYLESNSEKKLLIVGNTDTMYYQKYLKIYSKFKNVVFLGGVYNSTDLKILRKNAFVHLHGHSVGGTNPSLLEAMGSKNVILAHDNDFNKAILENSGYYFRNVESLKLLIKKIEETDTSWLKKISKSNYEKARDIYSWKNIGLKYSKILKYGHQ
jgi:rhamnosyltransferase